MSAPHPMVTVRAVTPCIDCGDDMWVGERAYPVEGGTRCLICHARRIPAVKPYIDAVEERLLGLAPLVEHPDPRSTK